MPILSKRGIIGGVVVTSKIAAPMVGVLGVARKKQAPMSKESKRDV